MTGHVGAHAPRRLLLLLLAPRRAERLEALERKLGVDHHGGFRVWHMQQAIRPLAVRERRLERVGAPGQAVLDDCLHAQLPEGAPRLLVGEDFLQADHVVGKLGQVPLRGVDDGEPLVEFGDRLMGLARGLVEVGTDALGHAVEPLVDGARDVALARDADLGEALQTPFQLGKLGGLHFRLAPSPAHMHEERNGEHDERKNGEPPERKKRKHGVDGDAPDPYGLQDHPAKIDRFAALLDQNRNIGSPPRRQTSAGR